MRSTYSHLRIRSTSLVGMGGSPSLITVELPEFVGGGRSSSTRELSGGSDGPDDRSGSTGRWNPMAAPPDESARERVVVCSCLSRLRESYEPGWLETSTAVLANSNFLSCWECTSTCLAETARQPALQGLKLYQLDEDSSTDS